MSKKWIYNEVSGRIEDDSILSGYGVVATVNGFYEQGEQVMDSNGKLLAAAPDLLSAGETALRVLRQLQSYDLDVFEDLVNQSVSELDLAIARTK